MSGPLRRSFRITEPLGARSEDLFRDMVEKTVGRAVCHVLETCKAGESVRVSALEDEYKIDVIEVCK